MALPGMIWNGYQWVLPTVASTGAAGRHPDGRAQPGAPSGTRPLNDKDKLEMLRGLGYNLPKGWGPKGQRAWKNYLLAHKKGLDLKAAGRYWSANQKGAKVAPNGAGDTDQDRTLTAGGGSEEVGANPSPMSGLGAQFENLLSQAMTNLLSPSKFAMDAANAEYDGTINSLARQLSANKVTQGQNLHDIDRWYDQVAAQQKSGANANKSLAGATGASLNDTLGAISGALSGDAANVVGAWGTTLAAGLQGDANAQIGLDNSMKPFLEAQAAAAKTNEQNYMQKLAQELQAQKTGLIREKGQARSKYMADAENQRFQQLASIQNMMLGANQMGLDYDLKSAQLAGQQTQNQLDQAKLDFAREQMMESGTEDPSALPLDTRMKLIQALKGSVTSRGKSGAPMAKPQTLYNRFAAEMGLDTQNPGHRKFLLQVLRSLYPNVQKYPFKFAK